MAILNIQQLKRSQICSVLARNEWDYNSSTLLESAYYRCINEILSWYFRKNSKVSEMTVPITVSRICEEMKLDQIQSTKIKSAIGSFLSSKLYKELQQPIMNYKIQLGVGKQKIIEYAVPYIDDEEDKVKVIILNPNYNKPELLAASYEAKLAAIWAFRTKSRYVDIYNISMDKDKTLITHYKTNEKLYRSARKHISNMERLFYSYNYNAPIEVCFGCSRRNECPMFQVER